MTNVCLSVVRQHERTNQKQSLDILDIVLWGDERREEKSTFNAHAIGSGSFYNMKERKYV